MSSCRKYILFLVFNLSSMFPNVRAKAPNSEIAEILHRPIRALSFPDSSTTGVSIFIALAVPLEEPYKLISVAYFFEASYGLPSNSTYFEPFLEPLQRKRKRRNVDRAIVYRALESKFEGSGYNGRECLLRAICEASEFPLKHNGLIGDILHVLFTPTSSRHEQLPQDILDAELVGRNGTCTKYHPLCPLGLFDLIGVLDNKLTGNILALYYLMELTRGSGVKNITHGVSRHIRSIGFPEGSGMGIYFALGIPVDIPDKSVLLSLYFEANYGLPGEWNSTYYGEEFYWQKRSLDRRLAYDVLKNKFENFGYSGHACLLKTICETAKYPLSGNGVLGDILQILLTPSSSQDEDLPREITEAEYTEDCAGRYAECPKSPLDLITHYISSN